MSSKEIDMQQQILQAAEELVMEKGFDSTSTTEIARKVGCNQALVHYYFRTKENLFQQIFVKNANNVLDSLEHYSFGEDLDELIRNLVEVYFRILTAHPQIPFIVISQLISNDERRMFVRDFVVENERRRAIYYRFDAVVQSAVASGKIRPIETLELLINVVSLIVFTFVSLPMYVDWLRKDEAEVKKYLKQRQEEVVRTMLYSLRPLA